MFGLRGSVWQGLLRQAIVLSTDLVTLIEGRRRERDPNLHAALLDADWFALEDELLVNDFVDEAWVLTLGCLQSFLSGGALVDEFEVLLQSEWRFLVRLRHQALHFLIRLLLRQLLLILILVIIRLLIS